jgi:hypothetical protein
MKKKWLALLWSMLFLFSCSVPKPSSEASSLPGDSSSSVSASSENPVSSVVSSTSESSSIDIHFQVRFFNGTTCLETDSVQKGDAAVYHGAEPTQQATAQYSYSFSGWDKELSNILADTDFYAQFTQTVNKYQIRFLDDTGDVLETDTATYGETPSYSQGIPAKSATAQYVYSFSHWDPALAPVTGNADYTAVYDKVLCSYTIRFLDDDDAHTVLQSSSWNYGETPAFSQELPSKAQTDQYTYAFSHWNPEIAPVTENADYTAVFEKTVRTYVIRFLNDDDANTVLQSSSFAYGETPVFSGETPVHAPLVDTAYTFKGWTPEIQAVTGPATYTATYTSAVRQYQVTFRTQDSKHIYQQTMVDYGAMPVFPTTDPPIIKDYAAIWYVFKGWLPSTPSIVTSDQTYIANVETVIATYNVTYKNWDGSVLQVLENVSYSETPIYTGPDPTRPEDLHYLTYAFSGWSPHIHVVDGDNTYIAAYDATNQKVFGASFDKELCHKDSYTIPDSGISQGYTPATINYLTDQGASGVDTCGAKLSYYFIPGFFGKTYDTTDAMINVKATTETNRYNGDDFSLLFFIDSDATFTFASLIFRFTSTYESYNLNNTQCICYGHTSNDLTTITADLASTGSEQGTNGTVLGSAKMSTQAMTYQDTLAGIPAASFKGYKVLEFAFYTQFYKSYTLSIISTNIQFSYN